MNASLKHIYNLAFFEQLCPALQQTIPQFDEREFILRVFNNAWPELEFVERTKHIARVLHYFMPDNFAEASALMVELSLVLKNGNRKLSEMEIVFINEYLRTFGSDNPVELRFALEEISRPASTSPAFSFFLSNGNILIGFDADDQSIFGLLGK